MQQEDIAGAILHIDLEALGENYRLICAQVAPTPVAAVVKADGYGIGAVPVARALQAQGCRHFFVAHLSEAVALKPVLRANAALYILNGLHPGAEAACAALGAIPVLNSLDQIARWSATARSLARPLPAALQVDSGMARLGLAPEDVEALLADPTRLDSIDLQLIMSHLACADDPTDPFNARQAASFEALARHFPAIPRSLDNSGGGFLPRPHFDLVRAGIALYGGAPTTGATPMRPVIALTARITQTRTVPAGAGVGYGLTHRTDRPTRIATIPVGYADGWPRHLSNSGAAFIGAHRAPIIGRVSMDSITLDVTAIPESLLHPGAPVELIGPHQSVDQVAADAGTISYEILTRLGPRYTRLYHSAQSSLWSLSA
ncbi:MAG TPA: alanine racemase [Sphingobium sp.]|nr:alanine racemase [Sphingobium sp.]